MLRQGIARLALHQRHQYALVALADDGISLPVANAAARLNDGWALLDAGAALEGAAPLLPAAIAFTPHLLAAQVLDQVASCTFVFVDVLVDAFVADAQSTFLFEPSADLIGRELQAQVAVHLAPLLRIELAGIAPGLLAGTGPVMRAGGLVALG